jgi:hypothetical protein
VNIDPNRQTPAGTSGKRLCDIQLETDWPSLSLEELSLLELEKDPYHAIIPQTQFVTYIERSIRFGQEVAEKYGKNLQLQELINQLLRQGVRVQFKDNYPDHPSVRAQYSTKPPTIEIYRPSIQQIKQFFLQTKETICEEDCWLIHLYHEWFHHIEETKCGYTYQHLPKMKMKAWGPFTVQKPIRRTREIAAHAFTQATMKLAWSPLLLDHLILYQAQGWSITQIREHFQKIKQQWEELTHPSPPPAEPEEILA